MNNDTPADDETCTSCYGSGYDPVQEATCHCFSIDDEDDLEGEYGNCKMMPDGQCMLAGTEECDWECGRLG